MRAEFAFYFHLILDYLVYLVDQVGYLGIFVGMFLESTFVPIPSEIIMIPAGIAVAYGKMNLYIAIIVGVIGNVLGAIFNYYLAIKLGRAVILKIGKYFFVREIVIIKIEEFFQKHGSISTFIGRLIPGARHFISLPAGLARMDLKLFCIYTSAGSLIWTTVLVFLGLVIGNNQDLVHKYLHIAVLTAMAVCAIIAAIYIFLQRRKNR